MRLHCGDEVAGVGNVLALGEALEVSSSDGDGPRAVADLGVLALDEGVLLRPV